MFDSENDYQKSEYASKPRLRPKQVTVSLEGMQHRLSNALLSGDCPVFLDTNILIWSFGLNERASVVWQQWLRSLGNRLVIPAWVVHEYNQHTNQPEVSNPYKALPRKLQVVLDELRDCASRALDNENAKELGCSNIVELESRLREASAFSLHVAQAVSQNDRSHRIDLLKFYEALLDERSHAIDIHDLSLQIDQEFSSRSAMKLSPGGEDSDKAANRSGDIVIWKEILQHCSENEKGEALFLSNDVKRDWCYAPARIVLENGKDIPWSKDAAKNWRLPNPELILEFQKYTGERGIVFATIEQAIETLASTLHNPLDAVQFRELAQALRSNSTPTDQAVYWIHRFEEVYQAGLEGVASWVQSPSEVNMSDFEAWGCDQLKDTDISLNKVDWRQVFISLYL